MSPSKKFTLVKKYNWIREPWLENSDPRKYNKFGPVSKGQIISKRFFLAKDSPKKRTKTRRILVKTNSFFRFLGESTAWQFVFEINWPLVANGYRQLFKNNLAKSSVNSLKHFLNTYFFGFTQILSLRRWWSN